VTSLAAELLDLLHRTPDDVAGAALLVARVEFPVLDPHASMAQLDGLATRVGEALEAVGHAPVRERIAAVNRTVYVDEGFHANVAHYEDFRNNLLNVVLDRRTGIPISLAIAYMGAARRAGLPVRGVSFPGHFLLSVPAPTDEAPSGAIILDPFAGGRELGDADCRALLAQQLGDDDGFHRELLRPCDTRQIVTRLLNNLKRTYVTFRSFPQAWMATELLLSLDPTLDADLRDRGLLACHLEAFPDALRDLEDYLRRSDGAHEDREERHEIWEQVVGLRRRIASLN